MFTRFSRLETRDWNAAAFHHPGRFVSADAIRKNIRCILYRVPVCIRTYERIDETILPTDYHATFNAA